MKQSRSTLVIRTLCALIVIFMLSFAAVNVAAEDQLIDVDRTGSITFVITSSETNEHIGGGSVELYKVATVDKYGNFTLLPEFSTLGIDLNALQDTDESWSETAEEIALYIKNHSLEDLAQIIEINDAGSAIVTDVTTGLYVALQHEAPKGYNPFKPFIIPFPYYDGEEFNYLIIAKPKGTSRLPAEDCVVDLPAIVKTITGNGAPKETEFKFKVTLYEEKGNYPKLVNKSGSVDNGGQVVSQTENEIVLRIKGAGTAEIGTVTFDHPGDYFFMVSEINTGLSEFKYDKTVYWAKYEIRLSADQTELIIANIQVKFDNANGELIYEGRGPIRFSFAFDNTFRNPPPPPPDTDETTTTDSDTTTVTTDETTPPGNNTPPPRLPQTGQVWWPAMVLAAVGVFFIFAGVVVSKHSRNREDK